MSMVGRFNDTLYFDRGTSNTLNVAGTLLCGTSDAGKEVRIEATISQNGGSQPCHDDFTIPDDGSLDWTMPVSTSNIRIGTPASGTATATVRDGSSPVPLAWTTAPIAISRQP